MVSLCRCLLHVRRKTDEAAMSLDRLSCVPREAKVSSLPPRAVQPVQGRAGTRPGVELPESPRATTTPWSSVLWIQTCRGTYNI